MSTEIRRAELWAECPSRSNHSRSSVSLFLADIWVQDVLILGMSFQRQPLLAPPAEIHPLSISELSTHHPIPPCSSHGCPGSSTASNPHSGSPWRCFHWNVKTAIPAGLPWTQHKALCGDYVARTVSPPNTFRNTMWKLDLPMLITHYNPVLQKKRGEVASESR